MPSLHAEMRNTRIMHDVLCTVAFAYYDREN